MSHRPRIVTTEEDIPLFVHGVLRPVVVVPQAMIQRTSLDQLVVLLTHEFAHLRRRDPLAGWVVAVCEVIYYFHPAFHLARYFLLLERETACDVCTVRHLRIRSAEYAQLLIKAAGMSKSSPARPALPYRVPAALVTAESFTRLNRRLLRLGGKLKLKLKLKLKPASRPSMAMCLLVFMFSAASVPGIRLTYGASSSEAARGGSAVGFEGKQATTEKTRSIGENATAFANRRAGENPTAGEDPLAEARTRTLTVRVRGADGNPVVGAGVEIISNFRPIAGARSGDDGKATVTIPASAAVQWIIALKDGVGFDYIECWPHPTAREKGVHYVRPADRAEDLTDLNILVLDGARTIRFHAVDPVGSPVGGVTLVPWIIGKPGKRSRVNLSGSRLASAASNSDGVAEFNWIPGDGSNEAGSTFLIQSGEFHWPDPPERIYDSKDDLDLPARLLRKTTISGTVRFPDGRPAPSMFVLAEGRGKSVHYCRKSTRTRSDGSYTLSVYPEQSYTIAVIDEEWTAHVGGVLVHEHEPANRVDLELDKGKLIQGIVTRSLTIGSDSRSKPVPGELV